MFDGWMQLAGNEVINVARTMAYANSGYVPAGLSVQDCLGCDALPEMLGDKKYESPMLDEAPWFESGNPDTWDFAGVLPLEITGLNGSTRRATVTEMVSDGGAVAGVRFASRTIAVTALLLGKSTCAVEAGLSWLSTVLGGSKCSGPPTSAARSACEGDELCVLTCCPDELADVPVPGEIATTEVPAYRWVGTGGFYDATEGEMTPSQTRAGVWTNLVRNPSFENETTPTFGWTLSGAASAAVSGDEWPSRWGSSSLKVTGTAPPTAPDRINLLPNPSAETSGGWIVPDPLNRTVTRDTTLKHSGLQSAKTTVTLATPTRSVLALRNIGLMADSQTDPSIRATVEAGKPYTFSAWARSDVANVTVTATLAVTDDLDAAIGQATKDTVLTNANTWYQVSVTYTPTASGRAVLSLDGLVPTAAVQTGKSVWVDDALLEQTNLVSAYFDGDTPASGGFTYGWTGGRHASTSTRTPTSASAPAVVQIALPGVTAADVGKVLNVAVSVGTGSAQVKATLSTTGVSSGTSPSKAMEINSNGYGGLSLSVPITAPAPAAVVTVTAVGLTGGGGALPSGAVLYVDRVVATVDAAARNPFYFDGDNIDAPGVGFTWNGTPHESTSTADYDPPEVTLTGPVIPCVDEALFDFGVSTIKGAVRVQAEALDAETGAVLWTGPWIEVSGVAPAVTILPEVEWGDWVPRLRLDPATPRPFDIAPVLAHARYKSAQECLDEITRSFLDVTTIEGPTVVDVYESSCGERYYKVEWTMVAGNPAMLGPIVPFVDRMSSDTAGALGKYKDEFHLAYRVNTGIVLDPINDDDTACATTASPAILDVFDPCCTGLLAPPTVPYIEDSCFDRPTTYHRTWIQIPADYAPQTEDGLLSMEVLNDGQNKRGLRIRVYPDPIANGYAGLVECDFCDEFFITYIPANATWRLDGPTRRVTTQPSGRMQQIISSASVRGRDGGPFDFPAMQCNTGYLITVDVPDQYAENCGKDCAGQPQGDVWVSVSMRRSSV